MKIGIGSIAVVKKGQENPYKPPSICGEARSRALGLWVRGKPVPDFDFWYAPTHGGAQKLEEPPPGLDDDELDYYWDEDGEPLPRLFKVP